MYRIESNIDLGFIEVTVAGCWREDEFDTFANDLRAAIIAFPSAGRPPMALYNYTGAMIQQQAVVAKMRALAMHPSMIDRKAAMYSEGVLARQQVKRVAEGRETMRLFDSRAAALAFLLDDDQVAHDAPLRMWATG